jgi:hypothetical protein
MDQYQKMVKNRKRFLQIFENEEKRSQIFDKWKKINEDKKVDTLSKL